MIMMITRNIARYIISIVFIFSGFVKAIDPLGSTYKFSDYFEAFGIDFLIPLSLPFAIILSSTELLIGLCLFFKIRMKLAAWALTVFMVFFTILTLIIAITNPVTDCGCFGDAIILTNWQTFFKNLFFLIPTAIVFFERNRFRECCTVLTEWIITIASFGVILILSFYCLANLPLIDFRPYKIGANIQEGMEIPEGMPVDEYQTVLVYEKDGIQKDFTLDSPEEPWSDSTWTWVETKNILVSRGYEPPIHDFSLTSTDGEEITDQVLTDQGYSFLIVAYDVKKSNKNALSQLAKLMEMALDNNYKVYGMTASVAEVVETETKPLDLPFEFYTTDDITLKTIIRSNPGLVLIKEGTIIAKWHYRNIPDDSFFSGQGLARSIEQIVQAKNRSTSLTVVLFIGFIALLIFFFRRP